MRSTVRQLTGILRASVPWPSPADGAPSDDDGKRFHFYNFEHNVDFPANKAFIALAIEAFYDEEEVSSSGAAPSNHITYLRLCFRPIKSSLRTTDHISLAATWSTKRRKPCNTFGQSTRRSQMRILLLVRLITRR